MKRTGIGNAHRGCTLAISWLTIETGCTATGTAGAQTRYESDSEATVESARGSWNGAILNVLPSKGGIHIVGVRDKTNITLHAKFAVGADNKNDASEAFGELASLLTVRKREDGQWFVECPQTKSWHRSVDPATTGCANIRLEVPEGTTTFPLQLVASTSFGGIDVKDVIVDKLDLAAPFGLVAAVTPTKNAQIKLWGLELASGMCSTILRVPESSTIRQATLTVEKPSVKYLDAPDEPRYWLGTYIEGFTDSPTIAPRTATYTWQRGVDPFAAASIELHASMGKTILTTAPVSPSALFHQCEGLSFTVSP